MFQLGSGADIKYISTILALSGKFFIAAGFASIFLFSSELFPTIIRYKLHILLGGLKSFIMMCNCVSLYHDLLDFVFYSYKVATTLVLYLH